MRRQRDERRERQWGKRGRWEGGSRVKNPKTTPPTEEGGGGRQVRRPEP